MDLLLSASLDQLKRGYLEQEEQYTCLCCGSSFEKGVIYPDNGRLYEAERYVRLHIEQAHGSVFAYLVGLEKSVTGLSDLQRRLLSLFYQGKSDAEVQKEMGSGSNSTIRNHRFLLKEKERQARLFLAIMELLRERDKESPANPIPVKAGTLVSEQEKVIQKYLPYGTDGPLKSFSMPLKQKRILLAEIVKRFERDRRYTEKEVNQVLEPVFHDYVTLRRYLVDFGLMNRLPDGSRYWRSDSADEREEGRMSRRDELKRLAKETKTEAGVYQIRNTRNGKVLIESTRNLKTMNGHLFGLQTGAHGNKQLQAEWNEFGPEAFAFEVLEVLEKPETGYVDEPGALKRLKAKWLEQLQPYGERGYHPRQGDE